MVRFGDEAMRRLIKSMRFFGVVAGLAVGGAVIAANAAEPDSQRWRADLTDQLWYEHQCRVVSVSKIKEQGPKVEATVQCSDQRLFQVRKSAGDTFAVRDCEKKATC